MADIENKEGTATVSTEKYSLVGGKKNDPVNQTPKLVPNGHGTPVSH